jgi:hypothetical protein
MAALQDWEGPFVVAALICGRVDDTLGRFDVLDVRERFELPAHGPLKLTGRNLLLRFSRGGAAGAAKITTRLIGPEQYFSDTRAAEIPFTDDVAETVSLRFELDDIEVPHPGRYGFLVRTSAGAVLTWVPFTVTAPIKARGQ